MTCPTAADHPIREVDSPELRPTHGRCRNIPFKQPSGPLASLAANPNSFAKESGLVRRISKKFSPEGFLLAMHEATSTGWAPFNQLVSALGWQVALDFNRDPSIGRRHPQIAGLRNPRQSGYPQA